VGVTLAAVAIAWLITPSAPPLDDAYIVVHSGDALRLGRDSAYGVPALTGITSPAFLLLVLISQSIAGSLGGLRIAVALGVVAYTVGVWSLARAAGADAARRWLAIVAALTAGPVAINLVNGLETGWACALILWSLVGILDRRPLLVGLTSGILPAVRPDLAPMSMVLVAIAAWRETRLALRTIAIAAIALLPFVLWVHSNTGVWWPTTMAAKRWFFAEGCLGDTAKISMTARALLTWTAATAPIAAGLIVAVRDRMGQLLSIAAVFVIAVYCWSLPGALFHNEFRYVVPILTPIGVYGFTRLAAIETWPATVTAIIVIAVGCITTPAYVGGRRADAAELKNIAAWSRVNIPSGARVLVHDAGVISTIEQLTPIDLVGLKTPASIDAHRRLTWPSCGVERGRAINDIARAAKPDYFIVLNRWDEIFHFTIDLEKNGWELTTIKPSSKLSERSYAVYRLALRGANTGANR